MFRLLTEISPEISRLALYASWNRLVNQLSSVSNILNHNKLASVVDHPPGIDTSPEFVWTGGMTLALHLQWNIVER
jgi:hypothetical protein